MCGGVWVFGALLAMSAPTAVIELPALDLVMLALCAANTLVAHDALIATLTREPD